MKLKGSGEGKWGCMLGAIQHLVKESKISGFGNVNRVWTGRVLEDEEMCISQGSREESKGKDMKRKASCKKACGDASSAEFLGKLCDLLDLQKIRRSGKRRTGGYARKRWPWKEIASQRKRKNDNMIQELLPQGCTKDGKRYRDSEAQHQSFNGKIETRFSLCME